VDGSPHSAAALRWAIADATARSGEVTAVFCWQLPFLSVPGAFNRDEMERASEAFLLKTVGEIAPSPAVPLLPLVAEGDTTTSLLAAAEGASILALGIRGRNPFAGLMLGSVSQACAANSPCPVVLVKVTDQF
jgi:nucleotide-binding universal stress UspA family protein